MEAQAQRAAGLRLPRVSPATFRILTVAAVAAIVLVTVTGATVRLTDSGLGCDNWPRCGEGVLPERSFHAVVEFSNRGVGVLVGLVTLVTALAAFRVERLPRRLLWGALALPATVLAQGVLGGITVLSDLHPLAVMSHFLLSMVTVALAVVVLLWAHSFAAGEPARTAPKRLAWLAAALVIPLIALVVTGAFVTAAGPHPGGDGIRRLGDLEDSLYVHVRATAAFGIGFLLLGAWLVRLRERLRPELLLAAGVLGLLLGQMAVGEIQWRNELPWWLVLVHVTLATAVVGGMAALAGRLVQRAGRRA